MTINTSFLCDFRISRETEFLYPFYVQMVRFEWLKRETGEIEPAESLLNLADSFFSGVFLQNLPSIYSNQKNIPEFIPY